MNLDLTVQKEKDRLTAVETLLAQNPTPSQRDLENMATYILYGKDENGKNFEQRKQGTLERKNATWRRKTDKETSLDEIMENPNIKEEIFQNPNKRSVYRARKDPPSRTEDADIPGMQTLWQSIDEMARQLRVAEGKEPPQPNETPITDPKRIYMLKHWLIDLRRHQYYLKDSYKPTLRFHNLQQPSQQHINFDADCGYWLTEEEVRQKGADPTALQQDPKSGLYFWLVRRQKFDFTNEKHIAELINYYSDLYMELWDALDSWGRALLFDFEDYVAKANLSKLRFYILVRRIDRAPIRVIAQEIRQKFGVNYNESHISKILIHEIPRKIAFVATREKQLAEFPNDIFARKQCFHCGKLLPRTPYFFAYHGGRSDGLASSCKDCERAMRVKGGQPKYDKRFSDKITFLW